MRNLLTFLVLLGILLSLSASFVSAQESDPTDTPEVTTYVVQEGDTAESIAEMFGISVEELLAANGLNNANKIKQMVGEELVIPTVAQPTEEATEQPTEEATEQPTEEATEQPTEEATEQPTEEATPEPTEEATPEPTEEATEESPAGRDGSSESVSTSDDVEAAGTLPGSFTTDIIAIANLLESGAAEAPAMTLYNIDNAGEAAVTIDPVYPGGVGFVRSDRLPAGRFAGVIETSFPAAAAALTVNASAKTADAYTGFGATAVAPTLYGPIIYNKHFGWESTLTCQNAGSGTDTVRALLFQRGVMGSYEGGAIHMLSASVDPNESVVWDIADNAAVQADWPGGNEKFGYVRFYSVGSNDIACVVDNQNMTSPHVQAIYGAVPSAYAANGLNIPLVYNGHGESTSSNRATKLNSGFAIVNPGGGPVNVQVKYTATNGYTVTCSQAVAGNTSINWYTPLVWANGDGGAWSCDKPFPLSYIYDQTSFGSAQLTATGGTVLGITNHAQFDSRKPRGQGFSSLGVPTENATNRAVCPLAFNKSPSTDWVTGIRVANVNSAGSTSVTWRLVRAGQSPTGAGNFSTIQKTIPAGAGASSYFPIEPNALANFEGAVFVEAQNATDKILATSVNSHFGGVDSVAMYDCINY